MSAAAAASASFCPASCLHAAVSNLEAEQHLSHPATYHSLLSTESHSLFISISFLTYISISYQSFYVYIYIVLHVPSTVIFQPAYLALFP